MDRAKRLFRICTDDEMCDEGWDIRLFRRVEDSSPFSVFTLTLYNSIMRYLIVLFFTLSTSLFACTGDCLTCHPALLPTINSDERHKPMLTCIECHSAEADSMAECGSDCFSCHPVEKIEAANVKEHAVIRECRDCHLELQKKLISIEPKVGQSRPKTLKAFILP